MKVPLLDLKAHHDPIEAELLDAIKGVLRSQVFILGPEVEKLEQRLAPYCQAQFAVGVSSGTDALLVALMALEVGAGDEVITTPYSFFSTAGVIARLGATPVFADIEPSSYNVDSSKIEAAVTPRTKAIIPVHLFGQCADMTPILKVGEKCGIRIVEDAAQAIGAEYLDGRRAGSMGDLGCLSFFPSKNLGALGDAGMVVTSNPEIAERLRILRVHGAQPKYHHRTIGGNFRLDALQAAVLNVKLHYLDEWTRARQARADFYMDLLGGHSLVETGFVIPPPAQYRAPGLAHYHIYNQFVIRALRRDALKAFLADRGIATEIYYPVPFHLQECFRYLGHREGDFPEAERAARETLALPVYPELTRGQQEYIVEQIGQFYQQS